MGRLERRARPQFVELPPPHVSRHERQRQQYGRRMLVCLLKQIHGPPFVRVCLLDGLEQYVVSDVW